MNTLNVFIRADGNSETGLGHLVRCISLALMFGDTAKVTFFSKEAPQTIIDELNELGIGFENIEWDGCFLNRLSDDTITILDGYAFDLNYQKQVKKRGTALVCIDDVYDREFAADLIINHAPGVTPADYRTAKGTKFALGPDYALLRPPFLKAAQKKIDRSSNSALFICFGGSDLQNKTSVAIEAALEHSDAERIIVVAGASYPYLGKLQKQVRGESRVELHNALGQDDMLRLMIESSTAIVPSSGILFEVLAAGCKAISGIYVENQKQVYNGFKSMNAILDAGEFSRHQIVDAINKLDEFESPRIIDGKSPERIRNLFKQI